MKGCAGLSLFRVLLRHGMSYTAFEALARRVYVQVAIEEFGLPGKKPSISRTSSFLQILDPRADTPDGLSQTAWFFTFTFIVQ